MRVALVAPLVTALRASQAGGSQSVVCDLASGLLAAGDDVLVLAARGSRVPGVPIRSLRLGPYPGGLLDLGAAHRAAPPAGTRARAAGDGGVREGRWPSLQAAAHLEAVAAARAWRADVLHVHAHDWPAVYAASASGMPSVHTLHLPPEDPAVSDALRAAHRVRPRPLVVAVSRACAAQWRGVVPVDAVVPNGVDPGAVDYVAIPEPDLAVVPGRVAPEKGTHLAVAAALRAGMRVVVAGPVYDAVYMEDHVAPLVDGRRVTTVGPLRRDRLGRLLGRAAVVVLGTQWEEPFGMVALEANLAGTPVAAPRRGGLPEALGQAGGVLVDGVDAGRPARAVAVLAGAVVAARALERRRVRAAAVRRRPLTRTVDGYRTVYRHALEAAR